MLSLVVEFGGSSGGVGFESGDIVSLLCTSMAAMQGYHIKFVVVF